MQQRFKELSNYNVFSKHRQFLMGVATLFIGIFHLDFFAPVAMHKYPVVYETVGTLYIGVEIFLFLSGIGLYFAYSKKPQFKTYYIKRVISVYCVFLLINLPYAFFKNYIYSDNGFKAFVFNELSFSYWTRPPGETRPGWYVVFIMIIYLIYPLIFKALSAFNDSKHDLVFTISLCLIFIFICIFLNEKYSDFYFVVEIGLSRIPIFIIGCYVGKQVYNKKQIPPLMYFLMILGILIKMFYYVSNEKTLLFNRMSQCFFSVAVMFFLIILAEFLVPEKIYKFFEFFGTMSLEFYLTHNFLKDVIKYYGFTRIRHYFLMLLIAFALSFVISRLRIKAVKCYLGKKSKEHVL